MSLPEDPLDPDVATRVRESFARQRFMATIGASIAHLAPGEVDLELGYDEALTQQDGFLHAGVVAAALDSACGYAAYTLMAPDDGVLTVEFKINLLEPAAGERFVARGRVVRAGRTLTICRGDAYATAGATERHVATVAATMMAMRGRAGATA